MTISDSNISTSVWDTIRTKLVSITPYVQNSTTLVTTLASVEGSYNDTAASRPQIVIDPILLDENGWTFGSTEGDKFINVVIHHVYKEPLGMDQLYDQVRAALALDDLDGMDLVAFSTDYGFNAPGVQKMHTKTLTATYERQ